jgi:hypothetical protein
MNIILNAKQSFQEARKGKIQGPKHEEVKK